jgi:hypothetical protein
MVSPHERLDKMKVRDIPIKSWRDFEAIFSDHQTTFGYKSWIYRGLPSTQWSLKSTLFREFERLPLKQSSWRPREREILDTFKETAHHHLRHLPRENTDYETLEWWSLMQHFGAPTRLLDWTYSPHTAAFFAIEDTVKWNETKTEREFSECCVYGLYVANVIKQNKTKSLVLPKYDYFDKEKYFAKDFASENRLFVNLYRPRLRNQRLIAQQGVFTVQNVIDMSLEEVLCGYDENQEDAEKGFVRFVFENDADRFGKYVSVLHRMNISSASLFPGIEGLSRSLHLGLMDIASKF